MNSPITVEEVRSKLLENNRQLQAMVRARRHFITVVSLLFVPIAIIMLVVNIKYDKSALHYLPLACIGAAWWLNIMTVLRYRRMMASLKEHEEQLSNDD
jgi:uncharacterized membrane protein (DUF485 family)